MSAALEAPGVALDADRLIALRALVLATNSPAALAALPGGFTTRHKGHGLEVADLRDYVPGDDIRHLDRGTTARTGKLHVRQFQQERDRVSLLVADFRPSMFFGIRRVFRSVAAAEFLALIGWSVVEAGGRVALLTLTQAEPVILAPRGRSRGMLDVIGGLVDAHRRALSAALSGAQTDPPLVPALAPVERISPAGAELVIASGFEALGAGFSDRIAQLGRRRLPRLVQISASGKTLPAGVYPIHLPDGRRLRLSIVQRSSEPPPPLSLAGRPVLEIDAGAPVEEMARRVVTGFTSERAA